MTCGVLAVRTTSKLDYSHDWTAWITSGDSIASRQWTISPTGPALVDDTTATVKIEGFVASNVYHLTESIVTAAGLKAKRDIILRCVG